MNPLQLASSLLTLCPIPTAIQDIIFGILVGYGTPSTNAIKSKPSIDDNEIPIRVVALGTLDRCRHTLYYMERTITHTYDNASYFSKEALFEIHTIYLKNKRTTEYTLTKMQELSNALYSLSQRRLIQIMGEESRIKNNYKHLQINSCTI